MREDIKSKIKNIVEKDRENFIKNIPENKCKRCNNMPEGKFCSRNCYLPTIFRGNEYRASAIISVMKDEFNVKDVELFDELCEELMMTFY